MGGGDGLAGVITCDGGGGGAALVFFLVRILSFSICSWSSTRPFSLVDIGGDDDCCCCCCSFFTVDGEAALEAGGGGGGGAARLAWLFSVALL